MNIYIYIRDVYIFHKIIYSHPSISMPPPQAPFSDGSLRRALGILWGTLGCLGELSWMLTCMGATSRCKNIPKIKQK